MAKTFVKGERVQRLCTKCLKARLEFSHYLDGVYYFICPSCGTVFQFKERVF